MKDRPSKMSETFHKKSEIKEETPWLGITIFKWIIYFILIIYSAQRL